MERQVNELQPKDQDWINQRALEGRRICQRYRTAPGTQISPSILDDVFHSWWIDNSSDRISKEDIVNCLGCLFGEILQRKFVAEWKIVVDNFGTDLVLQVGMPSHSWEIYPISFVAKRVESNEDESGFFAAMEQMLLREIKKGS